MVKKRIRYVTIWDGIQYLQVPEDEGARLVEKDMAQIMPVGGTEMKFRKDFTGYRTREVRAADPKPSPAPEKEVKKKVAKKTAKKKADPAPGPKAKPWTHYRKAAAKYHGKTVKKTNKADVLAYMEKHLGTEG